LALALSLTRIAHASTLIASPDCSANGDSLNCRLQSVLHFLYGAAGVLALILLIVIAAAITIYQKNKSARRDRP
jgi:uncharacterized membrane protein YkgB